MTLPPPEKPQEKPTPFTRIVPAKMPGKTHPLSPENTTLPEGPYSLPVYVGSQAIAVHDALCKALERVKVLEARLADAGRVMQMPVVCDVSKVPTDEIAGLGRVWAEREEVLKLIHDDLVAAGFRDRSASRPGDHPDHHPV